MNITQNHMYWIAQCVGWGAFIVINYLMMPAQFIPAPKAMLSAAFIGLVGGLFTHGLRSLFKSKKWLHLSTVTKVGFSILVLSLMSLGWEALIIAFQIYVIGIFTIEQVVVQAIVFYFMYYFFVLAIWCLLYKLYHANQQQKASELKQLQLELAVSQAELAGLKFQMNPHFLFNALNSIRSLALEDPQGTRNMVTQLSGMLRYTLNSADKTKVPLEEEFKLVDYYLNIEKVRYEERLILVKEIDQSLLSVPVPSLIVQTLIENAIKHGVDKRSEPTTVTISVSRQNDMLCIRIRNPGQLPPEINENVGLANTRKRLALLHQQDADFSLNQQGEQVVAQLLIPMVNNNDH